jgi:tetratricopeptide (TPR) repeat protein
MKKILLLCSLFLALQTKAQEVTQLLETAQVFVSKEDYANARLVLNRALQLESENYAIRQELAYVLYLSGDLTDAMDMIGKVMDAESADEKSFQIGGIIYKSGGLLKDCERIYKKGLKKFPSSGALHSELGEIMLLQKLPADAIRSWEEGIDKDPAYPGNYFHAAKYYYFSKNNPILSILYGEIFINSESYTVRTAELKSILLEAYKQFYAGIVTYDDRKSNAFQRAVAETLLKQQELTVMGINTEVLTMIRTRFVLDWFTTHSKTFPHKLFEQQQLLAREGLFTAYNQWLFGVAANVVQHQYWINAHPKETAEFAAFHKNRIFRMPLGQNYR